MQPPTPKLATYVAAVGASALAIVAGGFAPLPPVVALPLICAGTLGAIVTGAVALWSIPFDDR